MREEDQQTRVLYELCSMISHVLRSPPLHITLPTISLLSSPPPLFSSSSSSPPHISPAAFGSLFIGISIALMLFGFVTFIIGFVLMPLVITLVLLFFIADILYNVSAVGRAVLWPALCSNKIVTARNYLS